MRNGIALACTIPLIVMTCLASGARAQLTLSLIPESSSPVQAGSIAAVDLDLTGQRAATIASIELMLSTLTGGASYVALPPNTDGFAEGPTLTNYLSFTTDGSLLDNTSLGFAAAPGVNGIPTGSNSLLLGTFWVQTPANASGSFPINITFSELLDANLNTIPVQDSGTNVMTVTPEPSMLAFFSAGLFMMYRRRPSHLRRRGISHGL